MVEIDGTPALKKYSSWTGKKMKDLEENNLLVSTITAPLGVKDRLGDLIAIRHPMYGNPDGSMNIGANLAVNTAVIQMEASVDELISSTGRTMKELNKEMNKLYDTLDELVENPTSTFVLKKLQALIRKESRFAAFKRCYIRENKKQFINYL